MRYRVEMVCFVEVPDHVTDRPEMHAFDLAYEQIGDEEANEVWITEAPLDEPKPITVKGYNDDA